MARVPRQCPGTCAGFARPFGPRPEIFSDFWGSLEGLKAIFKPFFSVIMNEAQALIVIEPLAKVALQSKSYLGVDKFPGGTGVSPVRIEVPL